jgi:diacylglycerol kinase family enzyme
VTGIPSPAQAAATAAEAAWPQASALDPAALVLLNPRAAGGRAAALVPRIESWLHDHAPGLQLAAVDGIDAALAAVARQPRGARIVLVGGDGTLHRMLPALLEGGCTLGLVPYGSGNDGARALGLAGLRWHDALALALRGAAVPMDIGELSWPLGRVPFASSLTGGFDSAVSERAQRSPGWLRGLPRYLAATLAELAALRAWPLVVRADDAVVHEGPALFASVLNTPSFGSGMPAVPHARIDDGRLDLLVAGRFGRLATAAMLPRLLMGAHLSHPRVATRAIEHVAADSPADVPLAADGEPLGRARAWHVRVLPQALHVVRGPARTATMARP